MPLRKEKLHLFPALMIAAENAESPVTYLVLSLRLCGLGGDRACRGLVDEMKREGYIRVDRQASNGDLREKVVRMTPEGWAALERYGSLANTIIALKDGPAGDYTPRVSEFRSIA